MQSAFYIFAVIALVGAILMLIQRNVLTSALYLLLVFICTAGIFFLLNAHLVAFLQIILYAGAIMVLFVIAIFIIPLREDAMKIIRISLLRLLALPAGAIFIWLTIRIIKGFQHPVIRVDDSFGRVDSLSMAIFKRFVLQFELMSILLLIGIAGAIIIAKRKL